jgi:hypothetical protein
VKRYGNESIKTLRVYNSAMTDLVEFLTDFPSRDTLHYTRSVQEVDGDINQIVVVSY